MNVFTVSMLRTFGQFEILTFRFPATLYRDNLSITFLKICDFKFLIELVSHGKIMISCQSVSFSFVNPLFVCFLITCCIVYNQSIFFIEDQKTLSHKAWY